MMHLVRRGCVALVRTYPKPPFIPKPAPPPIRYQVPSRWCSSSGIRSASHEINPEANAMLQKARLHFTRGEHGPGLKQLNEAFSAYTSPGVISECALMMIEFGLGSMILYFANYAIAKLGDKVDPNIVFGAALEYYDKKQPDKALELANRYIAMKETTCGPEDFPKLFAMYSMQAELLYYTGKAEEAMSKFEQVKSLPQLDTTKYAEVFREGKWAYLQCCVELKKVEKGMTHTAFSLLQESDLTKEPKDSTAPEKVAFLKYISEMEKVQMPQFISELNSKIIENEKVHPFWKSCVVLLRSRLTEMSEERRNAERYRAFMIHQNMHTLESFYPVCNSLHTMPEIDREKLSLALKNMVQELEEHEDKGERSALKNEDPRHNYWVAVANLSSAIGDYNNVLRTLDAFTKVTGQQPIQNPYFANAAIPACFFKKMFEDTGAFGFRTKRSANYYDRILPQIMATALIMEGNTGTAKKSLELITTGNKDFKEELIAKHLKVLESHKPRILLEDVNMKVLQKYWRELRAAQDTQDLKVCDAIINEPEFSKPLFAFIYYDALKSRASIYIDSDQPEKAARDLERIENEYPIITPYYELGYCYRALKNTAKLTEALQKFEKTIEGEKVPDQFILQASDMYESIGNYQKAYEMLSKCQDKKSKDWLESVYVNYVNGKRPPSETIKVVTEFLNHPEATHDDKLRAHLTLGDCHRMMDNIEKALPHYKAAMETNDPVHRAAINLVIARHYHNIDKEPSKALEYYSQAMEHFPVKSHEGSARCLFELDQAELALEQIDLAIKHYGSEMRSAENHYLRGQILHALEKDEECLEELNAIIEMNDQEFLPHAHFSRGKVYLVHNDVEKARADFNKTELLDPSLKPQIQQFIEECKKENGADFPSV